MKVDRVLRFGAALLIVAIFLVAVGALLFVTESALNIWARLLEGPRVILYAYALTLAGFFLATLWLIWRLVIRRSPKRSSATQQNADINKDDIERRLRDAEEAGMDVAGAREELAQIALRQQAVHLCFFGQISKGKSSLIKALVPEADVEIDVVGGSTNDIRHFRWTNADGAEIQLTDVPGISGHEGELSELAIAEARRAHLILFVCDGDLSRAELAAIEALLALGKPSILVMNKADRFSVEEQATLMQRLMERVEALGGDMGRDRVVAVSAGGAVDVVEKAADGRERLLQRERPADIGVLVVAINRLLGNAAESLDARRDRAIFKLASERLDEAEAAYRKQRAEQIIRNSTRKAVIGALAAVSPGTDIIIQGYIGTAMTQELCKLYGAAPRDLDIEQFLDMSQSRAGKALPLTLAVAGNGLKAFPGIGTVAGGFVHAVAYGLIFDALGRSLAMTLARHGELKPDAAAKEFEETIGEHIQAGVKRVAKMALEERTGGKR